MCRYIIALYILCKLIYLVHHFVFEMRTRSQARKKRTNTNPAVYYGRDAAGKQAQRANRNRKKSQHVAFRGCPNAQWIKGYWRCLNRYRKPR